MNQEIYLEYKDFIKNYVSNKKQSIINKLANADTKPSLLIVQVGDNFASNKYVGGKLKDCEEVGILGSLSKLDENITEKELVTHIIEQSPKFDGIIVQLPLPKHINVQSVIDTLPLNADVDGFKAGSPFIPCTPLGVYNLLMEMYKDDPKLDGLNTVILGRSDIVGKPMAKLLIEKTNATVTVCNSHTKNLAEITSKADIVISAIGKAKLVTGDMIKSGATVIDVGINRSEDNKICGDVDWESMPNDLKFLTPVPGGIGLLTRLSLLENVYESYNTNIEYFRAYEERF